MPAILGFIFVNQAITAKTTILVGVSSSVPTISPSISSKTSATSSSEIIVSSSATLSGITTIAISSLTSASGLETQIVIFGIPPQSQNATRETIPANTLAWTSWTVSNSTRMDGFENNFPIRPENYNSSFVAAIYVNGVLDTKTAYTIPPPYSPGQGYQTESLPNYYGGFPGTMPPSMISPGTVISLAILCSTPLTAFVSDTGHTYEAQVDSLPAQLPSSSSLLPYTLQMDAFSVSSG